MVVEDVLDVEVDFVALLEVVLVEVDFVTLLEVVLVVPAEVVEVVFAEVVDELLELVLDFVAASTWTWAGVDELLGETLLELFDEETLLVELLAFAVPDDEALEPPFSPGSPPAKPSVSPGAAPARPSPALFRPFPPRP